MTVCKKSVENLISTFQQKNQPMSNAIHAIFSPFHSVNTTSLVFLGMVVGIVIGAAVVWKSHI